MIVLQLQGYLGRFLPQDGLGVAIAILSASLRAAAAAVRRGVDLYGTGALETRPRYHYHRITNIPSPNIFGK